MKGNDNILVSKKLIKDIISLLDHTDCVCVWSKIDNQYIRVNSVPKTLVAELKNKLKD